MQSHDVQINRVPTRVKISRLDVIGTIVLAVLQLVLAWSLRFLIGILSMRSAGCTPRESCNFDLAGAAVTAMPVAGIVAVILTVVLSFVFAGRGRPLWHAAVLGLVLVSVVFVIAAGVNYWALTP